ncbi:hypothetical protein [Metabacillus litoralis]|uniref:hypothetical protein n=1 Tax=Metabacillus litoralis TaxID=152268 RepID=UPI001CFE083E|nr:hypothetical protein [Metabacillus litoralis]
MIVDFRWFVMKNSNELLSTKGENAPFEFYEQKIKKIRGRLLEVVINHQQQLLQASDYKVDKLILLEGEETTPKNNVLVEKNDNGSIYKASINRLKLPLLYDVIFIPVGGVLTMSERKKAIKALKSLYDSLKVDGEMIVDLFIQKELFVNKSEEKIHGENEKLTILESSIREIDFFQQTASYLLSIENWQDGELKAKERKLHSFIWFGMKEFKLILERIGFSEVTVIGDYQVENEEDFSNCEVFTFVAKKK